MKKYFQIWQRYANYWWYAPLIGLLAALDAFILVIPTDGLMIGAVLLCSRRWAQTFIWVALGSTIGAVLFAAIVQREGLPYLLQYLPSIEQNSVWIWSEQFMQKHGLWTVFLVALSPLVQHPAVALAALAELPISNIAVAVFLGRVLKYCLLAWVASHTPHLLTKLWGIQSELKEVIQVDKLPLEASDKQNIKPAVTDFT